MLRMKKGGRWWSGDLYIAPRLSGYIRVTAAGPQQLPSHTRSPFNHTQTRCISPVLGRLGSLGRGAEDSGSEVKRLKRGTDALSLPKALPAMYYVCRWLILGPAETHSVCKERPSFPHISHAWSGRPFGPLRGPREPLPESAESLESSTVVSRRGQPPCGAWNGGDGQQRPAGSAGGRRGHEGTTTLQDAGSVQPGRQEPALEFHTDLLQEGTPAPFGTELQHRAVVIRLRG